MKQFLRKICPEKRNSVLEHEYRAEILQRQTKRFLKKVNIGDIVFCTAEIHNVTLMEKSSDIFGNCKYKTIDGKIKELPSFCSRIISKGDKFTEYKTIDKLIADYAAILARKNGFRVEKINLEDLYVLKIYGDDQQEVSDFVTLCLEKDFKIEMNVNLKKKKLYNVNFYYLFI